MLQRSAKRVKGVAWERSAPRSPCGPEPSAPSKPSPRGWAIGGRRVHVVGSGRAGRDRHGGRRGRAVLRDRPARLPLRLGAHPALGSAAPAGVHVADRACPPAHPRRVAGPVRSRSAFAKSTADIARSSSSTAASPSTAKTPTTTARRWRPLKGGPIFSKPTARAYSRQM